MGVQAVPHHHERAAELLPRPRDPTAEDWVTAQGLAILHGRAAQVIARIQDLAAASPPRPGSEHDKIDLNQYWDWHTAREHQRNHLSRYHDSLALAA